MIVQRVLPEALETEQLPVSFLQTPLWAAFKEKYGWKAYYFRVDSIFLSVLVRTIRRLGSIAYVPMGPEIVPISSRARRDLLTSLAKELKPLLPRDTVFIRFDPPWEKSSGRSGIRKAVMDIQPPDTVILDLSVSEETLLGNMKPKWRYNIRIPEKKGVRVESYEGRDAMEKALPVFYTLYTETASRDGITIHSSRYYRDLFETVLEKKDALTLRIYIARHDEDALAAIIVLFYREEATYLYGASTAKKRNMMPAYALQWQAIRDAKEAGCLRYDFYGIPPTDDPAHPMHGLFRFKTGFGGRVVHRTGSLDIPLKPIRYRMYSVAEWLRLVWFKKIRKLLRRGIPGNS